MNMLKPYLQIERLEAGCDEAGRGCLAGPVVAAAVILPTDFHIPEINDSKKLTGLQRKHLRQLIEKSAIAFAVSMIDNTVIDEINILNASILAMHNALEKLSTTPQFILVDGNKFNPYKNIPHQCFIKGDGKYASIAAASILAKTYRDEYMVQLHHQFEYYEWNTNKGYPTKRHRQAIETYGISKFHRKTFKLLETQTEINFGLESGC